MLRRNFWDTITMIRKLILRLFLFCVALMGLAVLSIVVAGLLALRQPPFYAALRAQQFSDSDRLAAETFFEHAESSLKQWERRSIALQRRESSAKSTIAIAMLDPSSKTYHPQQDTHSITISEKHINAQLASVGSMSSRQFQHPRIQMKQDRISLACELVTSKITCILSADLQPALTSDQNLRVDLVSVQIGQLPLPLKTIVSWLPQDDIKLGNDLTLDLTDPTPHFVLDIADHHSQTPSIKSIACSEGEITIEFSAPILKRQPSDSGTTPLAMNSQD
jgi:uncharacterized protein YpmS